MNDVMRDLHNIAVLEASGMARELAEDLVRRDYLNGLREQRQVQGILRAWAKKDLVPGLRMRDGED